MQEIWVSTVSFQVRCIIVNSTEMVVSPQKLEYNLNLSDLLPWNQPVSQSTVQLLLHKISDGDLKSCKHFRVEKERKTCDWLIKCVVCCTFIFWQTPYSPTSLLAHQVNHPRSSPDWLHKPRGLLSFTQQSLTFPSRRGKKQNTCLSC